MNYFIFFTQFLLLNIGFYTENQQNGDNNLTKFLTTNRNKDLSGD